MDSYLTSPLVSSLFEWSYTLVIVGLLYYFLSKSFSSQYDQRRRIYHWIFFGVIVNAYGFSWLYTVYPLPWMDTGVAQLIAIVLLHSILSCVSSLGYSILALTHHPKIKKSLLPLVFASSLTLAEVFRSLVVSLLFYGKATTIGLHFTAGTIGNALSTTPLIEFAYFGGTFALTFILGYLVYILRSKAVTETYWGHGVAVVVILFFIHFLVPVTLPARGTTVGIITTNFKLPEEETLLNESYAKQTRLLHQATLSFASSSPTFIVYPEDTRYISHLAPEERTDLLVYLGKTLFIDGDTYPHKEGLSNISFFYSPKQVKGVGRGKEFLLPFSEYVPYFFTPLLTLFVEKEALYSYSKKHTYTPVYSNKTVQSGKTTVGTLICSEILSYSIIEGLRSEHPSIIFFQSRMDVFRNNPWFIMHLRSFTKVTAAQLRTPLISSTSNAPSFVISPYGRIERFIPTSFSTSTYTF